MNSSKRRLAVGAAWVAVAVLGGAALTGVALAAEQNSAGSGTTAASANPAPSSGTGASRQAGRAGLGPAARLRGLGARVVHGEATVRTKNGFQVVETQLGTVTEVSPTSLTARSADGFTRTWTLAADTIVRMDGHRAAVSDLAVGDTVRLLGPAGSGSAGPTARLVAVRPAGTTAAPDGTGSGAASGAGRGATGASGAGFITA